MNIQLLTKGQPTSNHHLPKSFWYSSDRTRKDERLSQPWSHEMVLKLKLSISMTFPWLLQNHYWHCDTYHRKSIKYRSAMETNEKKLNKPLILWGSVQVLSNQIIVRITKTYYKASHYRYSVIARWLKCPNKPLETNP